MFSVCVFLDQRATTFTDNGSLTETRAGVINSVQEDMQAALIS